MAGLDLTGVREVLDDLLFDGSDVSIETGDGVARGVLNDDGDIVEPDPEQLYSGPGLVLPVGGGSVSGARDVPDLTVSMTPRSTETSHRLLLPLDSDANIPVGAVVEQTAVDEAAGDEALVGRRFEVTEIPTTAAISVLRVLFLKPVP